MHPLLHKLQGLFDLRAGQSYRETADVYHLERKWLRKEKDKLAGIMGLPALPTDPGGHSFRSVHQALLAIRCARLINARAGEQEMKSLQCKQLPSVARPASKSGKPWESACPCAQAAFDDSCRIELLTQTSKA